jgi:group I intron endonuclease
MIIYMFKNKVSGKIYVGKTKGSLENRVQEHLKIMNKSKTIFHKALRSYGMKNFVVSVLEICDSLERLNEREVYWIKTLETINPRGYNLVKGGNGGFPEGVNHPRYGTSCEKLTKDKIRYKAKERWKNTEFREKMSKINKEINNREDVKNKKRLKMLGKKTGKRLTPWLENNKHGRKLKDKDIFLIKKLYENGSSIKNLALMFSVHYETIRCLIRKETWKGNNYEKT